MKNAHEIGFFNFMTKMLNIFKLYNPNPEVSSHIV